MNIMEIDQNTSIFLSIVKDSIYQIKEQRTDDWLLDDDIDWEKIYNLALKNNLTDIIYPIIAGSQAKKNMSPSLLEMWGRTTKRDIIIEYKKYIGIRKLLVEAEKEGIKLIFFKGCTLADLYPQYVLRRSSDIDIFVYKRDRKKAIELLERLGYTKNEEHSKEEVPVYVSDELYNVIELHFFLWEDYEGRKIDIMKDMNLVDEASLLETEVCGINLTTLGYEEHLIYQMFHIIKHFSTEAVGIRYLTDITLYINQHGKNINYTILWEKLHKLGFAQFSYSFFHLCVSYFNMNDDVMKAISPMDVTNETVLLIDMLNKGLLFEHKTSSWQILGIMTPYLVGDETVPKSKIRRKLKILFPTSKALPKKFSYAREYKILLPFAWIHKMLDFLIRYKKFNKIYGDWYNANEKLTTADYRLDLMKSLGLVEKN